MGFLNSFIGELSLDFPEANSQERGGILADGKQKKSICPPK